MRDEQRGDGNAMYPHKASFMLTLFCLPHSRATVKRAFSAINPMKATLRNRFSIKTLTGLLHTKRLVSDDTWDSFKILRQGSNSDMCKIYYIDHKAIEVDNASDDSGI